MPAQAEFQQRLGSIEQLLSKIETEADPSLRATVQELVQIVMDLHGAGIERIIELIRNAGDPGEGIVQKLSRDELTSSLLILYGLHPAGLETRVIQSLDKVRSRLRSHEAEVELLSIQDAAVRLRLHANGHGCGSTVDVLRGMVEEAVYRAAPDIGELIIEEPSSKRDFVPLEMLQGAV
ncbi:MAG TPA: NifU family protein [Bryobacteraceae bacterium]|jgi:Fe-S cluster biogenesis protein NfuA